jgi:SAM-dependent methyltransferase
MPDQSTRKVSFGQNWEPTIVDRFGVWLSWRQIRRYAGPLEGKRFGDFGCGYHATLARRMLREAAGAVLVDVALSDQLKSDPRVEVVEGALPGALSNVSSDSLDLIICTSVLEHLWEPLEALRQFRRILKPGGACLLNVPSWRGKLFLEFSAFRLRMSPPDEMDDHKTYYDVRDLWPLLVQAGFIPHNIQCFSHKFGLNTFAVCRVEKK